MAKLKNLREYIKAPTAAELGGECGICGDNLGVKWAGYYWVCGNEACSRKALEYEREFKEDVYPLYQD